MSVPSLSVESLYHPFQPDDTPPVRPLGDALLTLPQDRYDELAKYYAPFVDPLREEVTQEDLPFIPLARARNAAEREKILARLKWNVRPSTDERPYFYFVGKNHHTWLSAFDGAFVYPQPAVRWMFLAALVASIGLVTAPMWLKRREERASDSDDPQRTAKSKAAWHALWWAVPFFALTGFAFMVTENLAFLHLTLFVGGPLYALSVVLPSILIGYALGSLLTDRYIVPAGWDAWRVLGVFVAGAVLYGLAAKYGLPHLIGTSWTLRVILSVLMTVPLGAVLGIPVPWYMASLKHDDSRSLAWMWSVSSALNVMGSMLFVPVCYALGRTDTMVLASSIYAAALLWAVLALKKQKHLLAEDSVAGVTAGR